MGGFIINISFVLEPFPIKYTYAFNLTLFLPRGPLQQEKPIPSAELTTVKCKINVK